MILLEASKRYVRWVAHSPRQEMSAAARVQGRHLRRRYGLLSLAQGLTIGIAWAACFGLGQPQLAFPATALLVGLHFLALAPVFGITFDYAVGTLLCLLALGTVLLVPAGEAIWTWNALVGLGSACLLWIGVIQRLARGTALT